MRSSIELVGLAAPVTERDHVRGSLEAPVVIVQYGDYECPDCGRAYWVVKELLDELGDSVAYSFRNFPRMEIHPRAQMVAEALEAAGGQGSFWEMHDRFYEHQHQLDSHDLEDHAEAVGLDVARWGDDRRSGAYRQRVHEDLQTGRDSFVTSTPTFFINGSRYQGKLDLPSMLSAVREAASSGTKTGL